MHLTKSEQQIMEIFWQADHAMAQTEVVKTCVGAQMEGTLDFFDAEQPDGEGCSAGGWLRAQR